jgi:hypothetical protein
MSLADNDRAAVRLARAGQADCAIEIQAAAMQLACKAFWL